MDVLVPLQTMSIFFLQGSVFFICLMDWKMACGWLVVGLIAFFLQHEPRLCKLNERFKKVLIFYYFVTLTAAGFIGYYFNQKYSPVFIIILSIFNLFWGFYIFKNYKLAYLEVNVKAL